MNSLLIIWALTNNELIPLQTFEVKDCMCEKIIHEKVVIDTYKDLYKDKYKNIVFTCTKIITKGTN